MRVRKTVHRAWPMVWLPESAVMSRALKPLLENIEMRVDRLDVGAGIWLFASVWLAVLASLLPNNTVHVCAPSCMVTIYICKGL